MAFQWADTMVVPRAVSRAPMKAAKNELQMAENWLYTGLFRRNATTGQRGWLPPRKHNDGCTDGMPPGWLLGCKLGNIEGSLGRRQTRGL